MGWLTGWSYRRPVTITNTQANDLTDYQVLVTVDTASLIAAGKMKDDGSDIRFTDSDGVTLLPYWVEGPINASNTKVWVKVPQIPANGTKTIYLYYGNPNAQSESSIVNTFIREIDGAQPVKLALPMDEGSGTKVYDQSGNNIDGTIYGATWTTGRFGNALLFDGVDDYVWLGNPSTLMVSQFSIEAWFKTTATVVQQIYRWRRYGIMLGVPILGGGAGKVEVAFYDSGANLYKVSSAQTFNDNQWHHAVGTYDGSALRIYVDGALQGSVVVTAQVYYEAAGGAAIGRDGNNSVYHFSGLIDEVRIYNRALTAAEISDLYNNYGYATPNYPGRVLVRKRSDPEPSATVGNEETSEETGLVIIRQRRMLIMSI
jgi:hypothetical protein